MEDWLNRLTHTLKLDPVTREEVGGILRTARSVAHNTERRLAPLSAYVIGRAVGRREAAGEDRGAAFASAVDAALSLLPDDETEGDTTPPDRGTEGDA